MTRRISTPRRMIVMGKKRVMIIVGVRSGPRHRLGYRHFERYANAGIAQVCAIDQGIQGCSGFDLRLQALSPRCCRREERWKSIVRETDRLGSRGDSGA